MMSRRVTFDPAELPHPRQVKAWKEMSPARKYELLCQANRFTRELKRTGIRGSHPDWTPEEVEAELARLWLHART